MMILSVHRIEYDLTGRRKSITEVKMKETGGKGKTQRKRSGTETMTMIERIVEIESETGSRSVFQCGLHKANHVQYYHAAYG